jgi:hypothetical protein
MEKEIINLDKITNLSELARKITKELFPELKINSLVYKHQLESIRITLTNMRNSKIGQKKNK